MVQTTNLNGQTWSDLAGNFASDAVPGRGTVDPVDPNTILTIQATIDDSNVFGLP